MADCCFIVKHYSLAIQFVCVVCCVISQLKMTWLWLGVSARAMVLVCHLHLMDVITRPTPTTGVGCCFQTSQSDSS